jgi:thioredoxin-dependent peroxiredoxin
MKPILIFVFTVLLAACQSTPAPATPTPSSPEPSPTPPASSETPAKVAAPKLTVQDQDGKVVDFGKLYTEGTVLVFFYPKAGTPGCTAQACSLRDAYEELTEKGVTVIGVSLDDAKSQQTFQKDNRLPYILIPDVDKKVVTAFGVSHVGGFASRQAFLIKDGIIEWHDDSASTAKQAEDVLTQLELWSKP